MAEVVALVGAVAKLIGVGVAGWKAGAVQDAWREVAVFWITDPSLAHHKYITRDELKNTQMWWIYRK